MQDNKKIIKAQRIKNDEFFTIYEQFEILTQKYLLDKLKDKIIYCPCSAQWCNIVKVLQDYKEQLQYKELIYTSDDFRTHDKEFEYADVIFENPPFSLSKEFYEMIKKYKCQYFFYGSMLDISKEYMKYDVISGATKCFSVRDEIKNVKYTKAEGKIIGVGHEKDNMLGHLFYCPDGFYRLVNTNIYTNLPGIENLGSANIQLTKTMSDITPKYLDNTKILNVQNWRYFPKDYQGIAAISPLKFMLWYDKFDIVCYDKKIINPLLKINGKNIFERWFVKLKGSDAKLEDYIQEEKINKLF